MTDFFDGRAYAQEKEEKLKGLVSSLKKKGITPKLVSLIIGDDQSSILYQHLKKKAAERIGAELEIINLKSEAKTETIAQMIRDKNSDKTVHGVMIQLPLPDNFSKDDRNDLIYAIDRNKDVDGLRKDSMFTAPVVRAVFDALGSQDKSLKVAVVGAYGFEGEKITGKFKEMGFKNLFEIGRASSGYETLLRQADIVVSTTGRPSLIKPEMIKKGVVLIDVGSPVGDIAKDCYDKASFVSPVPGGIGPATIANLIENMVEGVK